MKCGILPAKETETDPWNILLVYLIYQYRIRREGHDETLILKDMNIINPTNGWFEIVRYNDKKSATIENLVEQAWLCIYPRPKIIMHDSRNELLGHAYENNE